MKGLASPSRFGFKEGVPAFWAKSVFWAYLLVLVLAEGTSANPADPDLWHRLAVGEMLWQTGHFPVGGTFSYLADYQNIADHEWGSAVIFYTAYKWLGGGALVLLKLITLGITLVLVARAGLRARAPGLLLAAFYALVLLALLPSFQSTLRSMAFTNLFLALWLYWYCLEREGFPLPIWAYVLTMVVWANLHGGFAIGLVWLVGVTVVHAANGLEWKKWAARWVLGSVATLINPFGLQLWRSTGRALFTTRQGFGEWAPVSWWPDVLAYPGYKLLLVLTVICGVWLVLRRGWKKEDRPALLLLGGFLVLSLASARHTSLFALAAGALLPGLWQNERRPGEIQDRVQRLGYVAGCFALVLLPFFAALQLLPGDGLRLRYPASSCPVQAADFLTRENVRGNLLVPFNYGSYALWRLRGRMRVSMDGRYDLVYRPETYRRVEGFFAARGDWKSLLMAPRPDAILFPVSDPIYVKLKALPDWREAFRNGTDAVFLPR